MQLHKHGYPLFTPAYTSSTVKGIHCHHAHLKQVSGLFSQFLVVAYAGWPKRITPAFVPSHQPRRLSNGRGSKSS